MSQPTDRSRVRRLPRRASYDRAEIDAIIDASPICHIAFVVDGQPYAIPTNFARLGAEIVLHSSPASRMMNVATSGAPVCLTFTILDGLVLARSAFHHSVNYRSAVIFGRGRAVIDATEKLTALEAIVNHLVPGRWDEVRHPSEAELQATAVAAIRIEDGSAKSRTGPPIDDVRDVSLPVWAGVAPCRLAYGPLQPASDVPADVPVPMGLRTAEVERQR